MSITVKDTICGKEITFSNGYSSGITVLYKRDSKEIEVGGWYDGMVSIGPDSISLSVFKSLLGIDE